MLNTERSLLQNVLNMTISISRNGQKPLSKKIYLSSPHLRIYRNRNHHHHYHHQGDIQTPTLIPIKEVPTSPL